ncbi:hypothetical protein ACX3VT_07740 [Aerococcus sanguinicola]|uniref:hypothetical protein n=1 Tax=unclassified Aerococcus TaxID=2618060 RepID=UPI0014389CA0|nr:MULTISPECIES: hypothetical protein [unclassified Aerococcus]MDK6233842.1 hypothetical protein [Aerococcus sp. UMB10185]MDK6805781.1 hypothetical protein [Aerococcus sp. UMB7834]MDK6856327.1 hypothetical protein [Aerococcus sp. UMB7533]MDK8503125.1 hypothetical protein [Aerococcus sp. UMB1112A]
MNTKEDPHSKLKKYILLLIILAIIFVGIDFYRNFDLVVEGYQTTRVAPETKN